MISKCLTISRKFSNLTWKHHKPVSIDLLIFSKAPSLRNMSFYNIHFIDSGTYTITISFRRWSSGWFKLYRYLSKPKSLILLILRYYDPSEFKIESVLDKIMQLVKSVWAFHSLESSGPFHSLSMSSSCPFYLFLLSVSHQSFNPHYDSAS